MPVPSLRIIFFLFVGSACALPAHAQSIADSLWRAMVPADTVRSAWTPRDADYCAEHLKLWGGSSRVATYETRASVEARQTEQREVVTMAERLPRLVGGEAELAAAFEWPEAMLDEDVQGQIFLQFVVDVTGEARCITVVRGLDPRMNAAARAAVQKLTFEPGQHDGALVPLTMSLPLRFGAPLEPDAPNEEEQDEPEGQGESER